MVFACFFFTWLSLRDSDGVTASDLVCGVFQMGFTVFSREFTNCFSQLCLILLPALSGAESSKQVSRFFKGVHKLFFSIVSNSSANLYLATSSHQLEFYLWFVFFAWAAAAQFYIFLTALCGSIIESTHNGAHH